MITRFILGSLIVWRLTSFLNFEYGPGNIFEKLRTIAGVYDLENGRPKTFLGGLLDCFWCLSVWVAMPVSVWVFGLSLDVLAGVLALSTGAILVDSQVNAVERG